MKIWFSRKSQMYKASKLEDGQWVTLYEHPDLSEVLKRFNMLEEEDSLPVDSSLCDDLFDSLLENFGEPQN